MTTKAARKLEPALPPDGTVITHAGQEYEVIGGRLIPLIEPTAAEKRIMERARRERARGKSEPLDKVVNDLGRPRRSARQTIA
jgi:hypothetical protein